MASPAACHAVMQQQVVAGKCTLPPLSSCCCCPKECPMRRRVVACRLAMDLGLLKCQGKTPEATMASALYTDVKRKLSKSVFTRCVSAWARMACCPHACPLHGMARLGCAQLVWPPTATTRWLLPMPAVFLHASGTQAAGGPVWPARVD